jgi:hypothetical protein
VPAVLDRRSWARSQSDDTRRAGQGVQDPLRKRPASAELKAKRWNEVGSEVVVNREPADDRPMLVAAP